MVVPAISGGFQKPHVLAAYSPVERSIASLVIECLYFTLLRVACAILSSSCQAVAVSRAFWKSEVPSIPVNVSRTGTRRRLRSRSGVFPNPEKLNPRFFLGKFSAKRAARSAQPLQPVTARPPLLAYARGRAREISAK